MSDQRVVVGAFADPKEAALAVQALHDLGLSDEHIGVIVHDQSANTEELSQLTEHEVDDKTKKGAVTGGIVGGVVGAALSMLIPGGGMAMAGKVAGSAIGGAALGATAGGLIGKLMGAGLSEEDAQYYELEIKSGRTVVIVQADEYPREVLEILQRHQASSIRPQGDDLNDATETEDPEATVKLNALDKN